MQVKVRALDHPCLLVPPFAGKACILLNSELHRGTRSYVLRHELGHVAAGDADEPTTLHFTGPLPEAEYVADLFAFADLITRDDCAEGVDWVERRVRDLVVLEHKHWYLRASELAPRLIRMRRLVDEWLD